MTQGDNPLKKYYRNVKLSVGLPSRGKYYADDVLTLNESGELPIYPMTAQDEITLQNPDALLTGSAAIDVIKSCVPNIHKPRSLLACDIDVLMIAIRVASYGEEANMELQCPKVDCEHLNTFTLPLDTLLNQAETLEESYEVVIDNGLTVLIRPGSFESMVRQQKTAFENTKLQDAINTPEMSDEQRIKILSGVFSSMSKLNFELINEAIKAVLFTDDDDVVQTVDSQQHIGEWIQNIDKKTVAKIEAKIIDVNKVGIAKTVPATCTECGTQWDAPIEFNPVNFS
jgi:hypothetical protein